MSHRVTVEVPQADTAALRERLRGLPPEVGQLAVNRRGAALALDAEMVQIIVTSITSLSTLVGVLTTAWLADRGASRRASLSSTDIPEVTQDAARPILVLELSDRDVQIEINAAVAVLPSGLPESVTQVLRLRFSDG